MQSLLFLIKLYYFPQTRLYHMRSIEFPLRFIRRDDHKLQYESFISGTVSFLDFLGF